MGLYDIFSSVGVEVNFSGIKNIASDGDFSLFMYGGDFIGKSIEVDNVIEFFYIDDGYPACQRKEKKVGMVSQKVTGSLQEDKGTYVVKGRFFDPVSGKMRQWSRSTKLKVKDHTKRKAEAMMKEFIAQKQAEVDGIHRDMSYPFSVYVKRFINRERQKGVRENTIKSYQDYIRCHIDPKLGNIPMESLSLADLEEFYREFLKTHKVSSARKVHVVVKGAIREAIRDGVIQYNIADNVDFPSGRKFTGASIYNETEVKQLLSAAREEGEPIAAAVMLAACYGLRRSEIIGLRWKDIDFKKETLTISNTVVQNGDLRIEEEKTKTVKSHRSIVLLPVTIPYLKELRKKQEDAGINTDKVVAWLDGQTVRPDYISRKTKQIMEKAGLPVIRFHDLRHTAASLLAPHVTPKQLQEFLGHEDIETTLGIYTHVMDEQKRATSAVMNSIFDDAATA